MLNFIVKVNVAYKKANSTDHRSGDAHQFFSVFLYMVQSKFLHYRSLACKSLKIVKVKQKEDCYCIVTIVVM